MILSQTKENKINILMLGSNETKMVEEPNEKNQFVRYRHIRYGEYTEGLHIAIKTLKVPGVKNRQLSDRVFTYPTLSNNRYTGLLDLYKLGKEIIKKQNIDMIVTGDPFGPGLVGYFLKKKFNLPLCIQLFGDYPFNEYCIQQSVRNRLIFQISRFLFKRADTIRVHGSRVKDMIISQLGVSSERIFVIPTLTKFSNFDNLDGSNIRNKYINLGYEKIVLYVGRFFAQKDIPNLLQAIKIIKNEFPKVIFVFVGEGPLRKKMEGLCLNLGIEKNVAFIGEVPNEEVGKFYQACDILVLPSLFEDTARVLIEAAYCGKPIVTTDTTGARDIVTDGKTGFVVEIKNPEQLAEKVLILLKNDLLVEEFGLKGKENIKGFMNEEETIKNIINLWKVTLEHGKS